jgi:hypothetical protein
VIFRNTTYIHRLAEFGKIKSRLQQINSLMHKYWGFGLNIVSEIEFPELLPSDFTEADVTVTLGKMPEKLEGEIVVKRAFSCLTKDEYLLAVKNVCKYYVGYGNKIVAEPAPGIDDLSIRLFLLGTVMAAVLYQRGDIPLHASAIEKDGRLILFAGNSGAGKSTLLACLATRGYNVFTDDVCVMQHSTPENKQILGTASYPMIKLWEDAISKLDNDIFTRDFKVRPQLPKYGQFFYDTFNPQTLPVDKIFILSPQNTADEIRINKLDGVDAFRQLEKQAYKYTLISSTKLRVLHFSLLSQLANNVEVFEVIRPGHGTNVELLSDALEKVL